MKVVNISKRKLSNLAPLALSKDILNTEGNLYLINQNGNIGVLKKLYHIDDDIYANKLYTISKLNNSKDYLPPSFCLPDSFVSVDDEIIGFTMPYIEGDNLTSILKNDKIKPKDKIKYLKQIGEMLESLDGIRKYTEVNDIYLNDLHDSNFVIDKKDNVHVIDLDSAKIGNNMTMPSRFLMPGSIIVNAPLKYKIDNRSDLHIPSKNTDLYCYNMIIMNYLYGNSSLVLSSLDEYYKYLNYLEDIGLDKSIIDSFSKLVVNTANVNPYQELDKIKDETVYRANEKVYKRVVR